MAATLTVLAAAANGNMAELGGFDIDSSKGQKKANLNERYGGLDIRILSNQTASLELSRYVPTLPQCDVRN